MKPADEPTITLEEQIEWVEARTNAYDRIPEYRAIAESLRRLREREWVPVGERLPDSEDDVLIRHVLGDRAECNKAYDVAAYVKGKWMFPWDRGELNNSPEWVTHWQPIAAPKERT